MKQIKNTLKIVPIFFFLIFISGQIIGQEWSFAQKDVWKSVEDYWELSSQGNAQGFLDYFHPDYSGWSYQSALPSDKATTQKFIEYDLKTTKTILYDIKPAAIKIHGEIAFVHYYYTVIYKDVEGKQKTSSGRWTDILMKQGNKWVLIGDHGGQTSKD